jgi:hypothetical protein
MLISWEGGLLFKISHCSKRPEKNLIFSGHPTPIKTMDPKVKQYISSQEPDRQSVMSDIHSIILEEDKTVVPVVEPMMGKEMILYKAKGMMKYGLAGVKKYMSLHVLPIYGSKTLHAKYQGLLNKAEFQKGCINFDTAAQMPLHIIRQLMADCAGIDLVKIREEYLKDKKAKAKASKKA